MHNAQIASVARARFVTLFVCMMNERVNYFREAFWFYFILYVLPILGAFALIPLHAHGFISDSVLGVLMFLYALVTVFIYSTLVLSHARISMACVAQIFSENAGMRRVLYSSASDVWRDVDVSYA